MSLAICPACGCSTDCEATITVVVVCGAGVELDYTATHGITPTLSIVGVGGTEHDAATYSYTLPPGDYTAQASAETDAKSTVYPHGYAPSEADFTVGPGCEPQTVYVVLRREMFLFQCAIRDCAGNLPDPEGPCADAEFSGEITCNGETIPFSGVGFGDCIGGYLPTDEDGTAASVEVAITSGPSCYVLPQTQTFTDMGDPCYDTACPNPTGGGDSDGYFALGTDEPGFVNLGPWFDVEITGAFTCCTGVPVKKTIQIDGPFGGLWDLSWVEGGDCEESMLAPPEGGFPSCCWYNAHTGSNGYQYRVWLGIGPFNSSSVLYFEVHDLANPPGLTLIGSAIKYSFDDFPCCDETGGPTFNISTEDGNVDGDWVVNHP